MENSMLKMQIAGGLGASILMAGTALAQTAAPNQPDRPGQVMTRMSPDLMRGSRFIGLDVYGADNQKIGDVDEVLVDRQGNVHGFVVGVGGFLGIGQKNVAIPFDQVQWMSFRELRASLDADQSGYRTNTAGSAIVQSTAADGTTQQVTNSSTGDAGDATGTAGASGASVAGNDATTPARAIVKMTEADLQNAPEFRYGSDADGGNVGTTGNTAPVGPARPGNAPQQ
jgi:sporulation protein YlmC with PRC-barrel domain